MKKLLAAVLAAILFLDIVSIGVILFTKAQTLSSSSEQETSETEEIFNRASVAAVGDNFVQQEIMDQARAGGTRGGYNFSYMYENTAEFISAADTAIINQVPLISAAHGVTGTELFNAPAELGDEIIKTGFDVINLASSHALDYGEEGLLNTLDYWAGKDVVTIGAYKDKSEDEWLTYQKINGVKIAYIAFTEGTGGKSLPEGSSAEVSLSEYESWLCRIISYASEKADAVIVLAQWGNEYESQPTQYQRDLAAKLGNWGATVIIGSHPHVLQPVEYITNEDGSRTLVAYSLGNFISNQGKPECILGGILTFDIVKNTEKYNVTIENVKVHGVVTHYGMNLSKIRLYLLSDYTNDIASKHGLCESVDGFSVRYLNNLLESAIDKEFIG